jgi:hypothetical protein
MVKQRGGDFTSGITTFFLMLLFCGALGLGMYFYLDTQLPKKDPSSSSKPVPTPDPTPGVPGNTPVNPGVDPNDFAGSLSLVSASYNPLGRMISVEYVVNGSSLMPKGINYGISFTPGLNGGPLSPSPGFNPSTENEALTEDQVGLHHTALLETTGLDPKADVSQLTVTGQIHYDGMVNGHTKKGTIGSPTTIKVSGV